jgi:vacuolar protein sorting-associated protein 13A/C
LTKNQFCDLVALSLAITRISSASADVELRSPQSPTPIPTPPAQPRGALNAATAPLPSADLEPELNIHDASATTIYPTIDLELKVNIVKLQLYDGRATSESNLDSCGIARFALNDNVVRFKMLSSGAGEAEVVLKSFTVKNTLPGNTKFREIIPAAKHDRNQFMVLFTMSGGADNSSLAVVTIDSPKVIFTLDPIFALLDFVTSAFPPTPPPKEGEDDQATRTTAVATTKTKPAVAQDTSQSSNFAFRVDMHDVAVTVLESDADPNSQAISLGIQQILMSQQVCADWSVYLTAEVATGNHGLDHYSSGHVAYANGQSRRERSILG